MPREWLGSLGLPDDGYATHAADAVRRGRSTVLDRWAGRRFIKIAGGMAVGLVLWDGEEIVPERETPGRIRVHDRGALWRLLLHPTLSFGDLYSSGRVEVDGDLVGVLESVHCALRDATTRSRGLGLHRLVASLPAPSLSRSRENIHHHYDLGNDFYEIWLDREAMQYTCAYYPQPGVSLEEAQRAKMDHVCRKLWLRPGERVAEAGCGWGGFALHMARHYGVTVRAFNISAQQIAFARERASREGLADRVEFVEDDYRNIRGHYDAFVSIGMLEHVGPGNFRELGHLIDRLLVADGRGLIHSIGRDRPRALNPWIRRRIFPGAQPPTLGQMSAIFEPAALSILDVENLRLHYAETLREWLARYEQNVERVRGMFDDRFVRAWRLYLASSIAAFTAGSLQLFQVLFARTGGTAMPWNRAYVYAANESPCEA